MKRLLAGLTAGLLALAPAAAQAQGVEELSVADDAVTVTVRGSGLQPETLRVTLDGEQVPATAQLQRQAAPTAPRIVLIVDTSGSMVGASMVAAQRAASDFARRVPADATLGLVSFDDGARVLVSPTRDRGPVLTALAGLKARGNTSLYDAVALGLSAAGATGTRRLVVLSDGADTASATKLADLTRRLSASGAQLDAVALTSSEATSVGLTQLAAAARGRVLPVASAAALSAAFRQLPALVDDQLTATVPIPPRMAGLEVDVAVSVQSAAGRLQREQTLSLPGLARVVAEEPTTRAALWAGIAIVGGGVLLLLLVTMVTGSGDGADRRRTRRLMAGYGRSRTEESADEPHSRFGETAIARTAVEWAGRVRAQESSGRRALALDRAGLRFSPEEWLLVQVTAAAAGAAVGGLLLRSIWLAAVLALLGAVVPSAVVRIKGARRMTAFGEQLPDSLRLISSSLMSGYAFPQALDGLVREGAEPIAGEISRALAEARLGVSLEDALDKVAHRMQSKDLHWAVMAVRVQRDVGGNLAEVLNTVAGTVRERHYLRRQVTTLTAEGRLSAVILVGMPVLVGLYTFANRREYMQPLWTTTPGLVMSAGAVALLVMGALWMRKLVDVEV